MYLYKIFKAKKKTVMENKKNNHPQIKSKLHPRNKHRKRYNFNHLIQSLPELSAFVKKNKYGDESIDFFNPEAVKMLNRALLKYYYSINTWDIPEGYLCPPIPSRADYIHYVADLLAIVNGKIPMGSHINCLDIGVGANCVYPIIGNKEYSWSFIGSDLDPIALESAQKIVDSNPELNVKLRQQDNPRDTFRGIIEYGEFIDLSICNPPFHTSLAEAQASNLRKHRNLKKISKDKPVLNFGGQNNELWCEGGELKFIQDMIYQSRQFSGSCFWFSTIVSKQLHLRSIYRTLNKVKAVDIKTIPMGQGNKSSRIVAWTFLIPQEQKEWKNHRWNKEE